MDFRIKTVTPEFWFTQSFQMFDASRALFQPVSSNVSSSSMKVGAHKGSAFLLGISIENAVKGILAHRGLLIIENEKLNTRKSFLKCSPHNLYELFNLIGAEIEPSESELLKRLSIYTLWAGKYGTPLSKNEFTKDKNSLFQRESDFEIANAMLNKLMILAGYDSVSGWPLLNYA